LNGPAGVPKLVLYADGRLLYFRSGRLWEVYLSPEEVCGLLAQIDGLGFFDLDPSDYEEPQVSDDWTTHIVVNAWRRRTVSVYALEHAVENDGLAESLSGLAATYQILWDLQPTGARLYQPERLAIRVRLLTEQRAAPLWPLEFPTLAKLAEQTPEKWNDLVVEGETATAIYALFNGSLGRSRLYKEGDKVYTLSMRPLLPLEAPRTPEAPPGLRELPGFDPAEELPPLTCDSRPRTPVRPQHTASYEAESACLFWDGPHPNPPLSEAARWGGRSDPGQFDLPWGLDVDPQGRIVVGDSANNRLQVFSAEGVFLGSVPADRSFFDLVARADGSYLLVDGLRSEVVLLSPEGDFLRAWPVDTPESDDRPQSLGSVAEGPDGTLYVAEVRGERVVVLGPDGTVREVLTGDPPGTLSDVTDMAVDGEGNLFVVEQADGRVLRRDAQGFESIVALHSPYQIAVGADGTLRVYCLSGSTQVLPDGRVFRGPGVAHLTSNGEWLGWLPIAADAQNLAVAPDGTLVFLHGHLDAEEAGGVIVLYDSAGNRLRGWGITQRLPGQLEVPVELSAGPTGDLWVADGGPEDTGAPPKLRYLDDTGRPLRTLENIDGEPLACDRYQVAAAPGGGFFLGDPCKGRIWRLSSDGSVLASWGEIGEGTGQINLLADLFLASDGTLYVADAGNRRVLQYSNDGELLREWPAAHLGVAEPIAVVRGDDGTFFLLDGESGTVVVRHPSGEESRWCLPEPSDRPLTLAVDSELGRVYVGGGQSWLYVFEEDGGYLGRRHIAGGSGVLVSVDGAGRVFVSANYMWVFVLRATRAQ
jgi:DNA-binding beta-propeller fold protein YncE